MITTLYRDGPAYRAIEGFFDGSNLRERDAVLTFYDRKMFFIKLNLFIDIRNIIFHFSASHVHSNQIYQFVNAFKLLFYVLLKYLF